MPFNIEETNARILTLKAKEERRKFREAATAKGFKRLEDYAAWLALEELAAETLKVPQIRRGSSGSGITINSVAGGAPVSIAGCTIRV